MLQGSLEPHPLENPLRVPIDRPGRHRDTLITLWMIGAAFATYFCMYAWRRPFTAASYEDGALLGGAVALKTAFVIAQLIGYTLSKFMGIRVCSELDRGRRARTLLLMIGLAHLALLAFAVLPSYWKLVAIFANGIPLGMVWGVVVSYLEGRRTSELLLAGLSCSFIVASGVVKDVGLWTMQGLGVDEYWMPAVVGLMFLPFFLVSVLALDRVPPPDSRDIEERVERRSMSAAERRAFVLRFLPGLLPLFVVYVFVTAFRDFRDNYGIELFVGLGIEDTPALFTRTEFVVAFGVMAVLATLSLIRSNRLGLLGAYAVMAAGMVLVGGSTLLLQAGHLSGMAWMIATGLGSYLTYVPFGSVLFDRIIAHTRVAGTAVFAIYVADALGYTGSIALQLFRDVAHAETSRLDFFLSYALLTSALGATLLVASGAWFLTRTGHVPDMPAPTTGALSTRLHGEAS